jgi:hypothetical protein
MSFNTTEPKAMKHKYTDRLTGCRKILWEPVWMWNGAIVVTLRNNIAFNQDAMKRKLDGTNPFVHRRYVTVTNQFVEQS